MQTPSLIYGTAWKEDETARLVGLALKAGFRGIDTANQRKHYHEAGVGAALELAFEQGTVTRDDLFIQTKFTHLAGQDDRLPYDPKAPLHHQVAQSFESSLQHLGVDRLDSYLLHGPAFSVGWADEDWQAWKAMEALQSAGRTRSIGVSNVSADQLEQLHAGATVKPTIVQNRCFTRPRADVDVRTFCRDNHIAYQGFSLLTGHRRLMGHPDVHAIAHRLGATVPQLVFRYCLERDMVVLTGTTSPKHMAEDLASPGLVLGMADLTAIDAVVA